MVNVIQQRHQTIMETAPVLMSQEKQRLQPHQQQQQQAHQHLLSPKSLENKDREDKSYKRDRTRSKSRDRRSKSSRSGGGSGRRDRSRSRDRRRRDRSRGRNRSRDRHHSSGRSRNSSSRGSASRSHRSRSPVVKTAVDGGGDGNKVSDSGEHQMPISPWACQYNNLQQQQQQQQMVSGPMVADNNRQPPVPAMFNQFRTPPQPPIIHVQHPNSYQQPQQPPKNEWVEERQQQSYMLSNDFVGNRPVELGDHYGGNTLNDDDEDDRQAEFDNNFRDRCNDNNGPASRRGPPGQDFHVPHQGFGRPRFPKRPGPTGVQHHRGGKRSFDEFGGGGGGPRFNHHQQQHQQPPRYGNFSDRGNRPSRFSSIQDTGNSKLNAVPPQRRDDGPESEDSKDTTPRYNDRYRYDVRNTVTPQQFDGLCVKVYNRFNPFSYGDIRLLFEGIHIDGSAIKIQKHRQGVAFVRFDNNHSKNLAMRVNGTMYKGSPVSVKHLDDEAYERENTDDRPYPAKVPPTVVDHVDLVDDDEDEDDKPVKAAMTMPDDNEEQPDKDQQQQKNGTDGGDGSDEENGNLVMCEKTAKDMTSAVSTEDGVDDRTVSPTQQEQQEQQQETPTKYLKLNQFPITVAEEDVLNEFDGGTNIRRVIFFPDGEFKSAALEFTSDDEAEVALKRFVCVLLGSTPVPVLRCTYKEYAQIKRKSEAGGRRFSGEGGGRHHHHHHHHHNNNHNHHHNPTPPPPSVMMQPPRPPPPHNLPPVLRSSNCIYVYGLPTTVTNTDITQFFADISVLPDKIHIMLSKMGRPTGESYCEFGTPQQAHVALTKDQCYLGPNLVYVEPIGRSDMIQAITKPMQQHNHHQDISWTGGMRGGGGPSRHNQQQNMIPPAARHQHQGPQQSSFGGRGGGHNGQFGGNRGQQQYMNNGGGGGYTPRMRGPGPGPGGPNTGPDGFGQPGCVVALDNVPYRADVQEIVEFFDGFDLSSQNVIRRFNDFGKPTGEARVNLRSPQDAAQAVRVLQNKPIFNRPVRLSLL